VSAERLTPPGAGADIDLTAAQQADERREANRGLEQRPHHE
jgi:hypothetical protein